MLPKSAYESLKADKKETRVFHLDQVVPGSLHGYDEQCFTGKLVHISLAHEVTQYYALSYVWGDPTPVSAILLDTGARIPIARNLLIALQHIYDKSLPHGMPIWIDAVCINQKDDVEKSWQVAQMGSIYSLAAKTIIFMGEAASEESNRTMDFFDYLGERVLKNAEDEWWEVDMRIFHMVEHAQKFKRVPDGIIIRDVVWRLFGRHRRCAALRQIRHSIGSPPKISAIHYLAFLYQPWWTRIWVVQELLLSRSPWFVYGSRTVAAERVGAACLFISNLRTYMSVLQGLGMTPPKFSGLDEVLHELEGSRTDSGIGAPAMVLYRRRRSNGYPPTSWSLGSVLLEMRSDPWSSIAPQATNSLDQIYGLLSLVESWPPNRTPIVPDYSKNYIEVYAKATVAVLETTSEKAHTLLRVSTLPKKIEGLPSWVLDWSADWGDIMVPGTVDHAYNTVITALPYEATTQGRHLLTISGQVLGSIQMLNTPLNALQSRESSLKDDPEAIIEWLSSLHQSIQNETGSTGASTSRLQGELITIALLLVSRLDKIWCMRNLGSYSTEGKMSDLNEIWAMERINELVESLRKVLSLSTHEKQQDKPIKVPWRIPYHMKQAIRHKYLENTVVRTENDYLGVTRDTVRARDLIVRFDIDDCIHFVVRQVEDGCYELISMAFMPHLARNPSIEGQRMEFTLC